MENSIDYGKFYCNIFYILNLFRFQSTRPAELFVPSDVIANDCYPNVARGCCLTRYYTKKNILARRDLPNMTLNSNITTYIGRLYNGDG